MPSLIGPSKQLLRTPHPLALLDGEFHFAILFRGPAVAEQAGDGDL